MGTWILFTCMEFQSRIFYLISAEACIFPVIVLANCILTDCMGTYCLLDAEKLIWENNEHDDDSSNSSSHGTHHLQQTILQFYVKLWDMVFVFVC